ncbi:MAG TPA: zf-HC2 domain-containing protein [Dehalococcoidia bacterium]|jgi:anti-sigma factor RsiW
MNCEAVEELMSDLIDGELSDEARAHVEQHMASCDRCASSYKQLVRTVRFVRSNADVELVPGTPGGWYAEFTRSMTDDTFGRSTLEVLLDGARLTQDLAHERNSQ